MCLRGSFFAPLHFCVRLLEPMRPLTDNNIEAELSYAYLHAVAAKNAMACRAGDRHEDNNGIDAQLSAWGSWPETYLKEVTLNFQLKATKVQPRDTGTHIPYYFKGIQRYNDLRQNVHAVPRLLVVLFLLDNADEWLFHSTDQLALRRCAFWVSLLGAPASDNGAGVTIQLPKSQMFSPDELSRVVERFAKRDYPKYEAP